MKKTRLTGIILGKIIGLSLLVVITYFLNDFAKHNDNGYALVVSDLLLTSLAFLTIATMVSALAEIWLEAPFPANLPAPIVNAISAILFSSFFLSLAAVIIRQSGNDASWIDKVPYILYPILFFGVSIGGIVNITKEAFAGTQEPTDKNKQASEDDYKKQTETEEKIPHNNPNWEDIGQEFRLLIRDGLSKIRKNLK
jgi:ABC-type antimicrobial peptide transport system permease subunit